MEPNMTNKRLLVTAALVLVAAGTLYAFWDQVVPVAGLMVNYFRSSDAPPGTLTIEMAPPAREVGPVAPVPSSAAPTPLATSLEWPNYNRTLTSERYSPLGQIDRNNVGGLTVVCTYDTKEHTGFETSPIMVNGALIGTTEHDIFVVFFGDRGGNFYALDTATGRRLWGKDLGGAIGGGVITYSAGGAQKVAVAIGFTNILWPTKVATGKIVILGLPRA
jgi:alcohol dehydrogenase (cytochrome c)